MLRRSLDGGKTFAPEQTLFDREGIITNSGLKRYQGRLNATHDALTGHQEEKQEEGEARLAWSERERDQRDQQVGEPLAQGQLHVEGELQR